MINVLVNGCNGKMGQEVIKAVQNDNNFEVLCGVDVKDTGEYIFPVYTKIEDIKDKPDVIIDFSIPKATMNILKYATKYSIPIVIATTGFDDKEKEYIKEISNKIPVFQSANMSYDINLMKRI